MCWFYYVFFTFGPSLVCANFYDWLLWFLFSSATRRIRQKKNNSAPLCLRTELEWISSCSIDGLLSIREVSKTILRAWLVCFDHNLCNLLMVWRVCLIPDQFLYVFVWPDRNHKKLSKNDDAEVFFLLYIIHTSMINVLMFSVRFVYDRGRVMEKLKRDRTEKGF